MQRTALLSALFVCLVGLPGCGDDSSSSSQEGIDLNAPSSDPATTRSSSGTADRSADRTADRSADGQADASAGGSAGSSTTQPSGGQTEGNGASDTLTGTWVAENVSAPMGEVKIRLRFREDGPAKLIAVSELPLVGEVKNTTSPYHIENGKIVAPQLRGGVTMPYHFENNQLVVEYKPGQTVRFKKVKEEDPAGE